jgi:hypothetical protein
MATSLLDWILRLLRDPDARAAFRADPARYTADHGFGELTAADVHDALHLIADSDSASYDHHFSGSLPGGHYPPPPDHRTIADPHGAHAAARYLDHYLGRATASAEPDPGHRAVHPDLARTVDNDPVIRDSALTTGDGNVVGDDNHAVTGDHDTTAFGSGDATKADLGNSHFGAGGALSIGGDAHGHSTDNDTTTAVHTSGSGSTSVDAAGDHADAHQVADQHESDSSVHSNYQDESHTDSHDHINSHNDLDAADSHDVSPHR